MTKGQLRILKMSRLKANKVDHKEERIQILKRIKPTNEVALAKEKQLEDVKVLTRLLRKHN
jgi:stress response protein YsnF